MLGRMIPVITVLFIMVIVGSLLVPGRSALAVAHQATPAVGTPCPATTTEENKTLARRYYEEAFGQGHVEVLDEVLADDYVLHIPGFAGFLPSAQDPAAGRVDEAERIREFRTDFAEVRITIAEMVAEGDRVAIRRGESGTQADPLEWWDSPDTGRRMNVETWLFSRVACGKIAEEWVLPDNLSMMRQLGIITDEELTDAGTPTAATPVP